MSLQTCDSAVSSPSPSLGALPLFRAYGYTHGIRHPPHRPRGWIPTPTGTAVALVELREPVEGIAARIQCLHVHLHLYPAPAPFSPSPDRYRSMRALPNPAIQASSPRRGPRPRAHSARPPSRRNPRHHERRRPKLHAFPLPRPSMCVARELARCRRAQLQSHCWRDRGRLRAHRGGYTYPARCSKGSHKRGKRASRPGELLCSPTLGRARISDLESAETRHTGPRAVNTRPRRAGPKRSPPTPQSARPMHHSRALRFFGSPPA
ncbi:hypothetical protein C8R46DRAFT_80850 [Mycena filopes]|nr:hypothetical protein C8R46DRAFT_80850 [Mycena filopes]